MTKDIFKDLEKKSKKFSIFYVLDNKGKPKPVDMMEWAKGIQSPNGKFTRYVLRTEIGTGKAKILLSTIFLGMDYSFMGKGKPILWETMLFYPNSKLKVLKEIGMVDFQERYDSSEEAVKEHKRIAKLLAKSFPQAKVLQKKAI